MENSLSNQGKNILYLSQLSPKITDMSLKTFFGEFVNDITMTEIDHNYDNSSDLYFSPRAFIIFRTEEAAKAAFNALSMKKLMGKTVYIQYHKEQIPDSEKGNNLFVKGLPLTVSPREIYQKFSEYGDIISSKLCEDSDGNHLGYGYFNYSNLESVNKILTDVANQVKFFGASIQVAQFKRKYEREGSQKRQSQNKNVYIKNLSPNYEKEDLDNQFSKYGKIEWSTLKLNNQHNSKFAIIAYETEESAKDAIENENGKDDLYVDYLQSKAERKKIIATKIDTENLRLNTQYRKSNLHIRNLPKEINEENLADILKKYGEIKSLKIPKYILVSKVNDKIIETTQSKLFGYACFEKEQEASDALVDLNGKICPGFEDFINRPLIVERFMPRAERNKYLSNIYNALDNKTIMFRPLFNRRGFYYSLYNHPILAKHVKRGVIRKPILVKDERKDNLPDKPELKRVVNINYVNSLGSEEEKKDYLGEILYYKVENHPMSKQYKLSIETIAKITGMILELDDMKEKCQIINNYHALTQRISQACELLQIAQK
ncbi:MAG: hypothetical protein MJ252_09035 [archaeon]|nr:hypothetical protein [archaeon]